MKKLSFLLGLAAVVSLQAQDTIPTPDGGKVMVTPVVHGTLVLQWDGKTIYLDPHGDKEGFDGLPSPDVILVTDIHGDHLNLSTLSSLETTGAKFIVPQAVFEKLPDQYRKDIRVLSNGESTEWKGMKVKALPMYNLPESPDSRHTKGRGNGYLLNMGGLTIYISGDTDDTPEMRNLEQVDVAFVCMNPPNTMSVEKAADAVLAFAPRIVYPFHYRGSDVEEFKRLVDAGNKDIEVRLRKWYPVN